MVNLMLKSTTFQQTGLAYNCANTAGELGATAPGKSCGTTVGPTNPSVCTFWCAVAMGAILKGYPVESVSLTVFEKSFFR